MPDICDLVLDDHHQFRRRFAELDDKRADGAPAEELSQLWRVLGGMLERHASAEERLLYPRLLHEGANAEDETEDAVHDHNEIRAAVARASEAEPGSDRWWRAVLDARAANSDHIAEEERESLPDFRTHVEGSVRDHLGAQWLEFCAQHAAGAGLSLEQKDVDQYIAENE